ncbi:MAG: phosphonoacetaldehyde reductase [Clostridia bacterium]|nr:phosphonoacetaldehyde reductase [Clostridia bacterium]
MNRTKIIIRTGRSKFAAIDRWIALHGIESILLVCDGAVSYQSTFLAKMKSIEAAGVDVTAFSDFEPNPLYESAVKGVEVFKKNRCGAILAVGGGSALDVAKCIRLFSVLRGDGSDGGWLAEEYAETGIPFLAIPTTAGTGSEATRYAVVYFKGKKQSVTSIYCLPDTVILEPGMLKSLPTYQRKATMADALCHAIESYWSVNSTDESREFAREAILGILGNMDGYLANTSRGNREMLLSAHKAGKAINITQTTAGHAMCYKITGLFRAAHGHAALLCDRVLFRSMAEALLDGSCECIDPRGEQFLKERLDELGVLLGGKDAVAGAKLLEGIFGKLELPVPEASAEQIEFISQEVNPVRLKNHPVRLTQERIKTLYGEILRIAPDAGS